MNQKIKLLLSGLLLASGQMFAATSVNPGEFGRTKFFLPDYSPCAHADFSRLKNMEKSDDAIGLTVGLSGFWEQILSGSRSGLELAKGLSIDGNTTSSLTGDNLNRMFSLDTSTADVSFAWDRVEHRRLGVSGCGHYSLDNFYDGLWLAGDVTVLYERNKMTFHANDTVGAYADDVVALLKGDTLSAQTGQAALTALKLESGRVLSEVGVNDVSLVLGYRLVNNDNATVNIMGRVVAPTAFGHKTEYMFQPNPGIRNFKVGAGIAAHIRLVNDENYAISCDVNGQWAYGFKHKGEKIIPQHSTLSWAHYRLVGVAASTPAVVKPLANVLAEKATVDVEPKNEFCAGMKLSFEKGGLGVAAGYNFHYQQEKTLTVSGIESVDGYKFVTSAGAPSAASDYTTSAPIITSADFYSTSPSIAQHCICGDVSYLFSEWEFPLLLGVSGSYRFAQKRTITPEYWGIGLRAGLSF